MEYIAKEKELELNTKSTWIEYFERVKAHAKEIRNYIKSEVKEGRRVGVYGASTRGNTNLILAEIGQESIHKAYEKNKDKVGRTCPGTGILIVEEEKIDINEVQTLLVMPYSFVEEFVEKEKNFLDNGGKLVTLVPNIKEYKIL